MRGRKHDDRDVSDDEWAEEIVRELLGSIDKSAVSRVKSRIEELRTSVRAAKANPRQSQMTRTNAKIIRHAEAIASSIEKFDDVRRSIVSLAIFGERDENGAVRVGRRENRKINSRMRK
jgi:hypothetical protein